MMRARFLVAAAVLGVGAAVAAHIRLIHPGNGRALHWGRPQDVSIVIQAAGSDDLPDASHTTAIRNAIDAWNEVPGATVHLHENVSPAQRARTDWESSKCLSTTRSIST